MAKNQITESRRPGGGTDSDARANYRVATITREREFLAMREEWDQLVARCTGATPFQTFEWHRAWSSTVGGRSRLLIITARDPEGGLVGIAPFVVMRRYGFRVVELLGTGLSDYLDVITADTAPGSLSVLFDALLQDRSWDVACLQTPETGLAHAEATRRGSAHGSPQTFSRHYEIAPFLPIADSWDDFVRGKSKKFRYSVRERLNRFIAADRASFRRFQGTDVSGALVAALWEIEQRSWKAREGTAMLQSPRVREFYRAMLTDFGQRGWANVWLATIGDRPVAYLMTFLFRRRTYLYTLSFDAEFNKLAPGMLLLQESIRTAFDERSSDYDFLCGDESYKERWAEDQRRVVQTLLVRPTLRARLGALVAFRMRWALARSNRLRAIRLRLIGWRSRLKSEGRESSQES